MDINGSEFTPPLPFWEKLFYQNLTKFCSSKATLFINTVISDKKNQEKFAETITEFFDLKEIISDREESNVLLRFKLKEN